VKNYENFYCLFNVITPLTLQSTTFTLVILIPNNKLPLYTLEYIEMSSRLRPLSLDYEIDLTM